MIEWTCRYCRRPLSATEQRAGEAMYCPYCGGHQQVPARRAGGRIVLTEADLADADPRAVAGGQAGVPQPVAVQRQLAARALSGRRRACEDPALANVTCPFCLTGFRPDDDVLLCPECHVAHHVDCWQENGGCGSYGCKAAPLRLGLPGAAPTGVRVNVPTGPRYGPASYQPWICVCGARVAQPICPECGRTRGRAVVERVAAMDGAGRRTFRPARRRQRLPVRPAAWPAPRPARPPENATARAAMRSAGASFGIVIAVGFLWNVLGSRNLPYWRWLLAVGAVMFAMVWWNGLRRAAVVLRALGHRRWERGRAMAVFALGVCALSLLLAIAYVRTGLWVF